MARVLKELDRVRTSADAESVHDLRVAIRRCRSVASIVEEVDGHRTWKAVKRLPRKLFRALGTLRDLHVLEAWVKQLAAVDDPVRSKLLKVLEDREARPKKKVRRVIKAFDQARWGRLARKAATRARLVPPNSPTAQCLVLERYEDLSRLHTHAMHRSAPGPWHALRVGLKRFRYAVEILLPERSGEWDDGLGRMQSLLGEIHDLDVLRSPIAEESKIWCQDGSRAAMRHDCPRSCRVCMPSSNARNRGWNLSSRTCRTLSLRSKRRLYFLQTRTGKRTPSAALHIATDLVSAGVIDAATALRRLTNIDLEAVERTRLNPASDQVPIVTGIPAGLGVAAGAMAFDSAAAQQLATKQPVILVRSEISPNDIAGLAAATGVLTALGGRTSHAAVVARQLGKVCVVGCRALRLDNGRHQCTIGERTFREGESITIDGDTGRVHPGRVEVVTEKPRDALATIARWRQAM
jgi:CHAD domain-containing protein/phosphohistidine swiveling domain-containing protein